MNWFGEECFKTGKKLAIINGKLYLNNRILKAESIEPLRRLVMELSDSENVIYRNVTKPENYMYFYNEWCSGGWDSIEVRLVSLDDCK
jgi:hypothetical protein